MNNSLRELIVDDDPQAIWIKPEIIAYSGYSAITVSNGEEAY